MRRTGDRVHCAAASATYGREALPRQRGQGIRENPPPCRAEPRPMRWLLLCAGGPRQRRARCPGAAGIVRPVCPAAVSQLYNTVSTGSDCTSEFGTIPVINQLGQLSLRQNN